MNGAESVYVEVKKDISANDTDKNPFRIDIGPRKSSKVVVPVRNAEAYDRKYRYTV